MEKFTDPKKTCVKCGIDSISITYDRGVDMLIKRCNHCGFEWSELPLNKKEITYNGK